MFFYSTAFLMQFDDNCDISAAVQVQLRTQVRLGGRWNSTWTHSCLLNGKNCCTQIILNYKKLNNDVHFDGHYQHYRSAVAGVFMLRF